jgi:hypothetical protein
MAKEKKDADEKMPIAAYSADGSHIWTKGKFRKPWEWKRKNLPSIHMPRRLSRITLEITDVRVERLNDISGHDVLAEGVDNGSSNPTMGVRWENMQKIAFAKLWNSINGPDSWQANPWVWAITFTDTAHRTRGGGS